MKRPSVARYSRTRKINTRRTFELYGRGRVPACSARTAITVAETTFSRFKADTYTCRGRVSMTRHELSYSPRNSAVYYTPPEKIQPARAAIGFLGAAVVGIAGAILYAKLQPNLSNLFVRGGAVIAGALVTGVLG